MRRLVHCCLTGLVALAAGCLVPELLSAAENAPAKQPAPAVRKQPANYRRLAPGVEITIAPDRQEDDTHATHDMIELLQEGVKWTPFLTPTSRTLTDKATKVDFHRKVWYLEFSFKPVRMIWVDVPQESGKMQRKLIWYLVYRVTNRGNHLEPKKLEDGTYTTASYDQDVRFFPDFLLKCEKYDTREHLDRIIPVAVAAIQQKEDPNRKLFNSVEIGTNPILPSTDKIDRSVWGVATWEGLDPRVDEFSVFVRGLTNAYKWDDPRGAYKKGDPPGKGREIKQKTLVLNFWRPGDEYAEDQRVIRIGSLNKVDYSWTYR